MKVNATHPSKEERMDKLARLEAIFNRAADADMARIVEAEKKRDARFQALKAAELAKLRARKGGAK